MAVHKLTPRLAATVTKKGMYADGGGLYLQVGEDGKSKSWIFRYHVEGRGDRQMGLGPLHTIGLAEARERARQAREQRKDGIDPIEARKAERRTQEQKAARQVTFRTCAEQWVERNSVKWEPTTLRDIKRRIEMYLYPTLGDLPVSAINVDLAEAAIKPIWETMSVTAESARQHLEGILDWGSANDYRKGDNPARLRGPLGIRLKPFASVHTVKPHRSLPYQKIGKLIELLRTYRHKGTGKRLLTSYILEFIILTAVRLDQARTLRWADIDWDNKVWKCEKHKRSKETKQPHIIPLSKTAMAILEQLQALQLMENIDSEYVFVHGLPSDPSRPYRKKIAKKPYLGNMVSKAGILRLLQQTLGLPNLTVHGFRSTFKSWAIDHDWPEIDSEMALAHGVGSEMSQLYGRDAKRLEPRRRLMEAWAEYCNRSEPLDAKIIPMRTAAHKA
jgi:integrase